MVGAGGGNNGAGDGGPGGSVDATIANSSIAGATWDYVVGEGGNGTGYATPGPQAQGSGGYGGGSNGSSNKDYRNKTSDTVIESVESLLVTMQFQAKQYNVSIATQIDVKDVVMLRKDVLDYFYKRWEKEKFDLYFQYDHNWAVEQTPLSANSGFYFVKNNWKTNDLARFHVLGGTAHTTKSRHG